jgi:short-subunit dehydrogenase
VNLAGRTVLLTGATGGIGHAIARGLHARGAQVLLTGRRTDVLEPLAAEIGGRAIPCDLADPAAVDRLAQDAGDSEVLVSNAALPASGHLHSFTRGEIDRAIQVNLLAPIALATALSRAMVDRGEGHLAFVSSLQGKTVSVGSTVYSATKFGLRGFGLGLREDLRDQGVGVSVIYPGFISDAGMFADANVELPSYVGTRSPEDVAAGVITAIERNRAEVDVAPLGIRAGVAAAGLVPELSSKIQRRLGSNEISARMVEGQRDKR